jgi:hypothetical protein
MTFGRSLMKKGLSLAFMLLVSYTSEVSGLLSGTITVDRALKEARKKQLQAQDINNLEKVERTIILKIFKFLVGWENLPDRYVEYFTHEKGEGVFTDLIAKIGAKQKNVTKGWLIVSRFLRLLRITLMLGVRDRDVLDIVHYMSIPANVGVTPDRKFEFDTLNEIEKLTEKLKTIWPDMQWKTSYEKLDDSLENFLQMAEEEVLRIYGSGGASSQANIETRSAKQHVPVQKASPTSQKASSTNRKVSLTKSA